MKPYKTYKFDVIVSIQKEYLINAESMDEALEKAHDEICWHQNIVDYEINLMEIIDHESSSQKEMD